MTKHAVHDGAAQAGLAGTVKWFDPVKGFGFVLADDGGPDILLHANVLRAHGQSTVADGSRVSLIVQQTERGVQAVEIVSVTAPEAGSAAPLADLAEAGPAEIAALPLLPARVKWFDKGKGFGFANAFGAAEDIFVHIEVLRASALSELAPGEAVVLRVIDGRRGKMAAQVLSWDMATTRD